MPVDEVSWANSAWAACGPQQIVAPKLEVPLTRSENASVSTCNFAIRGYAVAMGITVKVNSRFNQPQAIRFPSRCLHRLVHIAFGASTERLFCTKGDAIGGLSAERLRPEAD